jgi:hypothetical protein
MIDRLSTNKGTILYIIYFNINFGAIAILVGLTPMFTAVRFNNTGYSYLRCNVYEKINSSIQNLYNNAFVGAKFVNTVYFVSLLCPLPFRPCWWGSE